MSDARRRRPRAPSPAIVPHSVTRRGWPITPSHFVHNQLDAVWLSE